MTSSNVDLITAKFGPVIQQFVQGAQTVMQGPTDFVNRPEVIAFIKVVQEHPQALRDKIEIRRRMLRQGLVPSNVVLAWAAKPQLVTPENVAREYAHLFRSRGVEHFALVMESLADVAEVGHHAHSLGAIFPEVERIARNRIYDPRTKFGITGIPSVRLAASTLLTDRSLLESLEAITMDHFIFTLMDAVDFAYLDDSDVRHRDIISRYRRVFRSVPNRHHVCHGVDADSNEIHVVNAFTVLYTVMIIAEHLSSRGLTVSANWRDGKKEFHRLREERRKFNQLSHGIAYQSQAAKFSA